MAGIAKYLKSVKSATPFTSNYKKESCSTWYTRESKTWNYSEGEPSATDVKHSTYYWTDNFSVAARIYNFLERENESCPVWEDVRDIFTQYYNLYPVMWKNSIIDLHSYENIKKHAKMLKVAMFKTDINDARYMPTSRDMSKSKKRLIREWIDCGMLRENAGIEGEVGVCTLSYIRKGVNEVKDLLQRAVMLELSTIPPYMTAWLSLKTEFGRNKEIAKVLSTIFVEEMLHMTLAGNILNAIGGSVNFTNERILPTYPNILNTGDGYQILPDTEIALGPFSIGLVDEVFSEIEKPPNLYTKNLIHNIGRIWKYMYESSPAGSTKSMKNMMNEISNGTGYDELLNLTYNNPASNSAERERNTWSSLRTFAQTKLDLMAESSAKTVGAFYSIIALKLAYLESCSHLLDAEEYLNATETRVERTIFVGKAEFQLNMSHWYQPSCSKNKMWETGTPHLFQVTDLKSALEAIVEIVYQGEGGSECSPLVTEPNLDSNIRGGDEDIELSHYYRFREIVNGRKLIKVARHHYDEYCEKCLKYSEIKSCPGVLRGQRYCYSGKRISFHADGVWPGLFNPKKEDYPNGSKINLLNEQFNLLYTRLLYCLQNTFGGKPSHVETCMSLMYDMTITGKKIFQTAIDDGSSSMKSRFHGSPTWVFVRQKPYRAGLPVLT